MAVKDPRHCPLALVVWREGKAFVCEEVEQGEKLSWVLLHLIGILNFDIQLRH
jgi:hypothetical protein